MGGGKSPAWRIIPRCRLRGANRRERQCADVEIESLDGGGQDVKETVRLETIAGQSERVVMGARDQERARELARRVPLRARPRYLSGRYRVLHIITPFPSL